MGFKFNRLQEEKAYGIAKENNLQLNKITTGMQNIEFAYVENGALTMNLDHPNGSNAIAKYTGFDLGVDAYSVKAKCRFYGGAKSTVALVSTSKGMKKISDITNGSIHVTFSSDGTSSIGYFNAGVLTTVQTATFPALATDGSVEYEMGWTVFNNAINVNLPGGTTSYISNSNFFPQNGRYIIYEHFLVDYRTGAHPEFTRFYTIGDAAGTTGMLEDTFKQQDGILTISPQGHIYTRFRNV